MVEGAQPGVLAQRWRRTSSGSHAAASVLRPPAQGTSPEEPVRGPGPVLLALRMSCPRRPSRASATSLEPVARLGCRTQWIFPSQMGCPQATGDHLCHLLHARPFRKTLRLEHQVLGGGQFHGAIQLCKAVCNLGIAAGQGVNVWLIALLQ